MFLSQTDNHNSPKIFHMNEPESDKMSSGGIITPSAPLRDGPLEITGVGVTFPQKNPERENCLKNNLQVVAP